MAHLYDDEGNDYVSSYIYDFSNTPMIESEAAYLEEVSKFRYDINEVLDNLNEEFAMLDEASYEERSKSAIFQLELLDIERYVEVNDLKEITNPTFFSAPGKPTSDGLLSNDIFGITQKDRAGTFAWINLYEYFMDPSCYKVLLKLDTEKFGLILRGIKKYSIDKEGKLVEDENGGTGIKWLRENFSKLNFARSDSRKRDMRIKYLMHNYKIGRMFIKKWIVIPPYYRDVNTSGKHTGTGQINTLYTNLIVAVNALRENNDYGLSMADTTCARVQDTIRAIYDWFCGNNNTMVKDPGTGMGGKFGYIRRNLGYTSDYASRLVLSAPDLKRETIDDLMVDIDKSAIPLAAAVADFYPFILFHIRRFFENELLNVTNYEAYDIKKHEVVHIEVNNPMLVFNDDYIKDNIKKFVYSRDTRYRTVYITDVHGNAYPMAFKGQRYVTLTKELDQNPESIIHRPLTWVDIIYIAAKLSTEGKMISFTRYPYDSYFNTIYTGIEISTTKETEPMYINGEYYPFYPKIRVENIGQSSSKDFIDTMQLCNLYLDGLGADYDGDTGNIKGSYFKETNEELASFTSSKKNFIDLGCSNIRQSGKEAVQAIYNLTKVLDADKAKLTDPVF